MIVKGEQQPAIAYLVWYLHDFFLYLKQYNWTSEQQGETEYFLEYVRHVRMHVEMYVWPIIFMFVYIFAWIILYNNYKIMRTHNYMWPALQKPVL